MIDHERVIKIIKNTRDMSFASWGNIKVETYKSDSAHDGVTQIDRQIELYLKNEFYEIYPDIVFVGEEYGGDRSAETYWIVDPIDGTGLFTRGLIGCSTMVALVDNGEAVFSVIYDFVHDTVYHALKGQGSYKDGKPIAVSNRTLQQSYISYESKVENSAHEEMSVKVGCELRRIQHMSAGYEYALIAEGKIDGRIVNGAWGNDYDFAPGTLLVAEAGGVVTNIGSRAYDLQNYDHIAANPTVHRELTEGENALFLTDD